MIRWLKSEAGRRIVKFAMVSVVSTLTSFTVITIVYGLQVVRSEVLATFIGNLVAAIPSFILNRRWTWGKTGRSHFTNEVLPFLVIVILGISVSLLGADYAHHLVHHHRWSRFVNTAIVDGANIGSFALFWVLKLLLLNRLFRAEPMSPLVLDAARAPRDTSAPMAVGDEGTT
jgi:putative flippase GtrA